MRGIKHRGKVDGNNRELLDDVRRKQNSPRIGNVPIEMRMILNHWN